MLGMVVVGQDHGEVRERSGFRVPDDPRVDGHVLGLLRLDAVGEARTYRPAVAAPEVGGERSRRVEAERAPRLLEAIHDGRHVTHGRELAEGPSSPHERDARGLLGPDSLRRAPPGYLV